MKEKEYNLDRFLKAQELMYPWALREIKNGRKQTHWMWYIFPQLKMLGRSSTALYYGIDNLEEIAEVRNVGSTDAERYSVKSNEPSCNEAVNPMGLFGFSPPSVFHVYFTVMVFALARLASLVPVT